MLGWSVEPKNGRWGRGECLVKDEGFGTVPGGVYANDTILGLGRPYTYVILYLLCLPEDQEQH